jgi:hypothetical protein
VAGQAGATGIRVVRGDARVSTAAVVAACRRVGARLSLTTGLNPSIAAAIAAIPAQRWTPIRYPNAVEDPVTGALISNAETAEIGYTAFTGQPKAAQVAARLIVRRVKRLDPNAAGQGELFDAWRYQAVFTDSPLLQAEAQHRDRAILSRSARRLRIHLPDSWPWQIPFDNLFTAAHAPP